MILSGTQIQNNSELNCDLCIIGGGPAAITVALELEDTGKKIVMLTGGDWYETAFYQDANRGISGSINLHEPLEENRRRQFGGASAAWGGRCMPLDPIDFEERPWIPHSGWPIAYNDVAKYYGKATAMCDAGDAQSSYNATTVFPGTQKEIYPGLDDENILSWPLERWSRPINFAKYYQKPLEESRNIQVILEATVTRINSVTSKERIDNVTVVSGEKKFRITAGRFVLAAGGIENARLMLISESKLHPHGIGNDYDNVGRYYMAHISGVFAELDPRNRNKIKFDFEKDKDIYVRRRWWMSENFQRKEKVGNIIMFLHHPGDLNGHRDALFSSVYVAKSLLSVLRQKTPAMMKNKYKQLRPAIKEHFRNLVKNGFSLIPQMVKLISARFAKRRLPFILPSIKSKYLGLYYQAEHMPIPESRVTLAKDKFDALGMPRVVVDVAFSQPDVDTVIKSHHAFIEKFKAAGAGDVIYDENTFPEFIKRRQKKFNSMSHHLGTTRMADSPEKGVVDANSKVFGIDNLYVAGASVFPTGGHANPTLTIVALALRLADHLKQN